MAKLCARLVDAGLGAVRVSVGERLSYPDEKITCGTAAELASREFDKLSVALIENPAPDAVVTHGLPDEVFLREMDPGARCADDKKRGARRLPFQAGADGARGLLGCWRGHRFGLH